MQLVTTPRQKKKFQIIKTKTNNNHTLIIRRLSHTTALSARAHCTCFVSLSILSLYFVLFTISSSLVLLLAVNTVIEKKHSRSPRLYWQRLPQPRAAQSHSLSLVESPLLDSLALIRTHTHTRTGQSARDTRCYLGGGRARTDF